ncbi:hypothetical protein EDB19DRAFT_1894251 [Suillus lakei]|nr:hypothetical protein EDB19DRAFT_1894251 [Suillus lakei]
MSETFVRNLNFQTNDLGREATLLLTFDGNMKGLYKNFYPIVWRVCTFGREGSYSMRATYTSQLAFLKAQVDEGTIIDAATCVNINVSDSHLLCFHFSDPVPGAKNKTGFVQNMAIGLRSTPGFMSPGELMPTPALYFNDVGDGSSALAKFTPKLRAYITSNYQQTAILQSAIDCTHWIWEHDLSCLDENTTWNLTYDKRHGYKITEG